MAGRIFIATLLCLLLAMPTAGTDRKRRKTKTDINRSVYDRKRTCETETCKHLVPLEAQNCVNECVSAECYRKVYAEPLEDGEVNTQLSKNFMACSRREIQVSKKRPRRKVPDESTTADDNDAAAAPTTGAGDLPREYVVVVPADGTVEDTAESGDAEESDDASSFDDDDEDREQTREE